MENEKENPTSLRSFIWMPIIVLIVVIFGIILITLYKQDEIKAPMDDFDKMVVTNGFHQISLPSGQHFDLSYEQNHDRYFSGTVRHISVIHEVDFPILSYDILVTSGDFADDSLVYAKVEDHHFTWYSRTGSVPEGTINLLHTVPMNQDVEDQLSQIKQGDHVAIKGWDILKIEGYSKGGDYLGYWQDSGCNTTLVTNVYINP